MAEFPALPLFTDALLGDTMHLTNAQFGSYLLLLIIAWRSKDCSLPDDDVILARYARMDKRVWRINKPLIMGFWKLGDDKKYRQGRLQDERKYVEQVSNKNSENANIRWLKNKKGRHASAMPDGCQTDAPTPTPTPTLSNTIVLDKRAFLKKGKKHGENKSNPNWIDEGNRLAEKYHAKAVAESGQSGIEQSHGEGLRIATAIRKDNGGT